MHKPIVAIRTTLQAPSLPYERLAAAILPRNYELSLVVCGDDLARRMNAYRKKTYSPNVLSFPITKTSGEIFLNVRKAEREARMMGIPVRFRLAHLFVHGCAHLRGLDHGSKMDALERTTLKKSGLFHPAVSP